MRKKRGVLKKERSLPAEALVEIARKTGTALGAVPDSPPEGFQDFCAASPKTEKWVRTAK